MQEIGPTLREARLRAKVDISEVEAHTKIRAKYLRALENEEWDLLPGATYVKTFLRTYAEYLGLDARLLVNEWKRQNESPAENDAAPLGPPRRGGRDGRGLGSGQGPTGPRPPRIPRSVVVVVALVGVIAALAVLGSIGADNGDDADVQTERQQSSQRQAAERRRERRQRQRQRRRERQRQARQSEFVRLQLVPTGEVWVCLQDASGERLVAGEILAPGSQQPTYRSRRFTMTFGNGDLDLRVNGRVSEVPPSAEPVGYVLDRNGRKALPEDERPTCA